MVLKELEIQGFKSFPDRIKIPIDRGITAVVGQPLFVWLFCMKFT